MKQGDLYLADLDPTAGGEQWGVRPVVVISGNAMNDHFGVCIVCPLTSQVKGYSGCVVLQPMPSNGLVSPSEVLTFQVRTVSKARFIKRIGSISPREVAAIHAGLQDILTY